MTIGCLGAHLARPRIASSDDGSFLPPSRWLAAALLFETFVFGPIGAYLQYFHNAWSWMYFVPRERLDASASFLAVAAYFGSLLLGYALGAACVRGGSPSAPLALAVGFAALNLAFTLLTWRRLMTVATYDEFVRGQGVPMWRDPFGVEMALIGALFGMGLWACVRWGRSRPDGPARA